jgi:hypothetical protein
MVTVATAQPASSEGVSPAWQYLLDPQIARQPLECLIVGVVILPARANRLIFLDFSPKFRYPSAMRPMLATAHYATRKGLNRPFARVTARDRRMGQKLSMGLTPKQVARLEGMVPADVESLVAEPEFKALIDGYTTLHAMPEDEQRRILTQLARHLLMEATALGDVRVAMFILLQERMGKDPARTLADGVIAAARRAAQPAPAPRTPSPSPRASRPSDDPDLRTMQRVESRLRDELQQEHAAVQAAVAADEAPPMAEAAPELPQRQRRSPRPSSTPVLSDYQSRAIEALLLLKNAAPDEPPTPCAQAP